MIQTKILIVEAEGFIANDLARRLNSSGYSIPSIASSGIDALKHIKDNKPDLVLMDVSLQRERDGISAGRKVISTYDVPVIYLTAYADNVILKEVKKSGAYGFLVRPFKDTELISTLELALYRHSADKHLKESENRLSTTLNSINDAVISTNKDGMIIFMNPLAELLIGWKLDKRRAKNLQDIFNITNYENDGKSENLTEKIIRDGFTVAQTKYIMKPVKGRKKTIELSSAPILDNRGNTAGAVVIFRDITRRIGREKKILGYQKQLQMLTSQLSLIEENEKRRIATELHDCVGQTLALSKIKLGLLHKKAPSEELKNNINEILSLIEQTIKETRTLTFELSPPILYELGLSQAVKWLIDQFREKYGLNVLLTDDGLEKPFDNRTRFFLFQAVRELLINVVKHAETSDVRITMSGGDGELSIIIEDDGIGFSASPPGHDGYGLFNIRERMNQINGQFEIKSDQGCGTRVRLLAPMMIDRKLTERG
jgi:PAS domain S-box-containing protein